MESVKTSLENKHIPKFMVTPLLDRKEAIANKVVESVGDMVQKELKVKISAQLNHLSTNDTIAQELEDVIAQQVTEVAGNKLKEIVKEAFEEVINAGLKIPTSRR